MYGGPEKHVLRFFKFAVPFGLYDFWQEAEYRLSHC